MKKAMILLTSAYLGSVLPVQVAVPHHSAVAFDRERTVVLQGTVTQWFWANPHCLLKFDVRGDGGDVVGWVAETQAPANMVDAGWRKNDFKPGDEVTVTVQPARNGATVGRIVRVDFPDGRSLQIDPDEDTGNDYHLSGAPDR